MQACSGPADSTAAAPRSLVEWGATVLRAASTPEKCKLTLEASRLFSEKSIPIKSPNDRGAPDKPARDGHLTVVLPSQMKRATDYEGGSLDGRLALIHALAHIESYAIDLAWDIIVRFSGGGAASDLPDGEELPVDFYEDWLRVACEEADHFSTWEARLRELGSHYGALPVHDGLWQSAGDTSCSLLARLAVVHMTHEARGLDVTEKRLARLNSCGDKASAELLQQIELQEVTHVQSGMRWFMYVCSRSQLEAIPKFHELVRRYFQGPLRGPFDVEARTKAGFTPEWYLPLVSADDAVTAAQTAAAERKANEERAAAARAAVRRAKQMAARDQKQRERAANGAAESKARAQDSDDDGEVAEAFPALSLDEDSVASG